MKIYLAGPDVFLPDPIAIGRRKKNLCETYGHEGLYPLDNAIDLHAADASMRIFQANRDMMDRADAIIANLTPFRGPSADAGTVFELGYMIGQRTADGASKICLGYSNDPSLYVERVAALAPLKTSASGGLLDPGGMTVEDFGHIDNLMIVCALAERGFPIVTAPQATNWDDLSLFEQCLGLLNEHNS